MQFPMLLLLLKTWWRFCMEEKGLAIMWMKFGLTYSLATCKSFWQCSVTGYKIKNTPRLFPPNVFLNNSCLLCPQVSGQWSVQSMEAGNHSCCECSSWEDALSGESWLLWLHCGLLWSAGWWFTILWPLSLFFPLCWLYSERTWQGWW